MKKQLSLAFAWVNALWRFRLFSVRSSNFVLHSPALYVMSVARGVSGACHNGWYEIVVGCLIVKRTTPSDRLVDRIEAWRVRSGGRLASLATFGVVGSRFVCWRDRHLA